MNPAPFLDLVGLGLDIIGALVLLPLVLSKKRAVELGQMRLSGDTLEENLQLPAVKELLRQRNRAWRAGALLALGFLLQMWAVVLAL